MPWLSLPKAAKELEIGETWLRGEVIKAYNFPLNSPLKINIHWRIVGSRYQINTQEFPKVLNASPKDWQRTIKKTVQQTLEKEGVFVPELEEKITKAILNKLT